MTEIELKNLYENQQLDLVISASGMSEYGDFKKICTYESCAVMVDHHPLTHECVKCNHCNYINFLI